MSVLLIQNHYNLGIIYFAAPSYFATPSSMLRSRYPHQCPGLDAPFCDRILSKDG
jgi:hypothetical protein